MDIPSKGKIPKPYPKPVQVPLIPPNVIECLTDAEEMAIKHGVDSLVKNAKTEIIRPHVKYDDLVGTVSIGIPEAHAVVNVPTTTAGIHAKKYVPALALYNMVEYYILEAHRKIKAGFRIPMKEMKELIQAQKEVTGLLNDAAGFMEHTVKNPSAKASMGIIMAGVVNITNEILGAKDEGVELSDVLQELDRIGEAKSEQLVEESVIEAQKKAVSADPWLIKNNSHVLDEVGDYKDADSMLLDAGVFRDPAESKLPNPTKDKLERKKK